MFGGMAFASVIHRFGGPVRISRGNTFVDVCGVIKTDTSIMPFSGGATTRPEPELFVLKGDLDGYVPIPRDSVTQAAEKYLVISVKPLPGDVYQITLRPLDG